MQLAEASISLRDFTGHSLFDARESVYVRWYPKTLTVPPDMEQFCQDHFAPLGAYIHVPFCDRLCRFCPFNKRQVDHELVKGFVRALIQEIRCYGRFVHTYGLHYVYFGGGTPSVLSPFDIASILDELQRSIGFCENPEITLECHPTHISKSFLRGVRAAGVTRFSSGFQSFDEEMLRSLGAQHTVEDIQRSLQAASAVGVPLGVDLLFRCEGQTIDQWRRQLDCVVREGIRHVSCYSGDDPGAW